MNLLLINNVSLETLIKVCFYSKESSSLSSEKIIGSTNSPTQIKHSQILSQIVAFANNQEESPGNTVMLPFVNLANQSLYQLPVNLKHIAIIHINTKPINSMLVRRKLEK